MVIAVIGLTGCNNGGDEKVVKTDAIKFKEEYESINGEELYGKKARELTIPEKNPFVYATADEIVEMMDNDETFAVYFGLSGFLVSVISQVLNTSFSYNVTLYTFTLISIFPFILWCFMKKYDKVK